MCYLKDVKKRFSIFHIYIIKISYLPELWSTLAIFYAGLQTGRTWFFL